MKVHWFSTFSAAGIILLAGGFFSEKAFSSDVRWSKPVNSTRVNNTAAIASVTHIPTVITTDDVGISRSITQVQRLEPVQLPSRLEPVMAPSVQNPPPGATLLRSAPQTPPNNSHLIPCTDQQIGLKSIREISHDIRPTTTGILPEECIHDSKPYYGRHFSQTCFMWKASALSTKAAYFEEAQLERHGHTIVCPALQPIVSGARFFATIPILPYKMGVTPPNECVYTLGHYRSGSSAPYMAKPFPISPRGALFQAGAVTGAAFVIP
jgi:hypothetical protein